MTIEKVCSICGISFTHKDKRRKYCSRECYNQKLNGEGNPFAGKVHSKGTVDKIKEKLLGKMAGDKNPFYGKQHNKEALDKIKKGNELFRENNKELVEERLLKRLNLTEEKIKLIYEEYRDTHETLATLKQKYDIDSRVLKKYFVKYGACSEAELKQVAFDKKYKNASSIGEETLYILLCNLYGENRVKRQHNISFYYYDFLVDDKFLVEYDGYYWHNLVENNDDVKTHTALSNGYILYRVREDEKRKVDFLKEIQNIKDIYEV
jgi:very-short-patch-repair endonuclease